MRFTLKTPDGKINWPAIGVFVSIVLAAFILREAWYFAFEAHAPLAHAVKH